MMSTAENPEHKNPAQLGRCTALCGDPLTWFPMRVTYSRELQVRDELTRLGIENFLPMKTVLRDEYGSQPRHELVPAVANLIFLRSTKDTITGFKHTHAVLEPLRFMVDRTSEDKRIMTVPDRQMENFMRVASVADDRILYLDQVQWVGKEGCRVRVTGGVFKGTEGVIRRVRRNKCVCVEIAGVVAVAIAFVPGALLEEIEG